MCTALRLIALLAAFAGLLVRLLLLLAGLLPAAALLLATLAALLILLIALIGHRIAPWLKITLRLGQTFLVQHSLSNNKRVRVGERSLEPLRQSCAIAFRT